MGRQHTHTLRQQLYMCPGMHEHVSTRSTNTQENKIKAHLMSLSVTERASLSFFFSTLVLSTRIILPSTDAYEKRESALQKLARLLLAGENRGRKRGDSTDPIADRSFIHIHVPQPAQGIATCKILQQEYLQTAKYDTAVLNLSCTVHPRLKGEKIHARNMYAVPQYCCNRYIFNKKTHRACIGCRVGLLHDSVTEGEKMRLWTLSRTVSSGGNLVFLSFAAWQADRCSFQPTPKMRNPMPQTANRAV